MTSVRFCWGYWLETEWEKYWYSKSIKSWRGKQHLIKYLWHNKGGSTYIHIYLKDNIRVKLLDQLCPTLCDPLDCSPPGSSVHGILQARILEWVAIFFSRGSSWPRDQTQVSRIAGRLFTIWATSEAPPIGTMPWICASNEIWVVGQLILENLYQLRFLPVCFTSKYTFDCNMY